MNFPVTAPGMSTHTASLSPGGIFSLSLKVKRRAREARHRGWACLGTLLLPGALPYLFAVAP